MTMFKSTQLTDRKKVVIKLGGSMLAQLNNVFFQELKQLMTTADVTIVHGGGPAINAALLKADVSSMTIEGIRQTSKEAMKIVSETLIGEVNPYLVGQLNDASIPAVGLNGTDANLLNCEYLNKDLYGYVGEILEVNSSILEKLNVAGYLPVVSCIGNKEMQLLNINGDTVASKIALALQAEELILVTDTPGVKINGQTVEQLDIDAIDGWIESGDIYGGMIPKVTGAAACLQAGIPTVKIVNDTLQGTAIIGKKVVNA